MKDLQYQVYILVLQILYLFQTRMNALLSLSSSIFDTINLITTYTFSVSIFLPLPILLMVTFFYFPRHAGEARGAPVAGTSANEQIKSPKNHS